MPSLSEPRCYVINGPQGLFPLALQQQGGCTTLRGSLDEGARRARVLLGCAIYMQQRVVSFHNAVAGHAMAKDPLA